MYECVTTSTRPDLAEQAAAALRERWPEFIFHDPVAARYMDRVEALFAHFNILLVHDGRVAAGGWGVPFAYSGDTSNLPDGYDDALARAVEGHEAGLVPAAFSFMAAAVQRDYDRQGLAQQVLTQLSRRAHEAGLSHIFAPLRPTWKSKYPTVSMGHYLDWRRPDGLSIDPWIRTHQRMGARIVGPAPRSMVIPGTVAEWETWAGMPFPESGDYVVPGALNLLRVDRESDTALYEEENLWVEHGDGAPASPHTR